MTPERLAEIRDVVHERQLATMQGDPLTLELLEYVDYLKGNLRSAGECIDAYVTACARGEAEIARLTAGQQPRCAFEPPCAECQRRGTVQQPQEA